MRIANPVTDIAVNTGQVLLVKLGEGLGGTSGIPCVTDDSLRFSQ